VKDNSLSPPFMLMHRGNALMTHSTMNLASCEQLGCSFAMPGQQSRPDSQHRWRSQWTLHSCSCGWNSQHSNLSMQIKHSTWIH